MSRVKDVTDGMSKTYLLGEIAWSGMGKQGDFSVLSYLTGYNGWGSGQFINPVRNIFYSRPINISKAEVAGGMTVATDIDSNATKVTMSTRPEVSKRRSGAKTPPDLTMPTRASVALSGTCVTGEG